MAYGIKFNRRVELIGKRFGKLTILGPADPNSCSKQPRTCWVCRCDCGIERPFKESYILRRKGYAHCGCLRGQRLCHHSPEVALLLDKWGKAGVGRYYQYRFAAKQRGYSFTLSPEEYQKVVTSNCHYCGKAPSNLAQVPTRAKGTARSEPFVYTGMDRVDNARGYEVDNVVPCCIDCNRAKHALTKEAFLDLVRRIYEHYGLGALEVHAA